DGRKRHRYVGEERSLLLLKRKADRHVVYFLDRLDEVRKAHSVEIFPCSARHVLVPGMILLPLAFVRKDDVVRVQIARRCEEVSGLEFDARAQLESVLQAVI